MLIGYARVFTNEQNLDLQLDALKKEGVSDANLYTDKVTGTKAERPGLTSALSHLRTGDTLVVWRLDRLARSLSNLIELVNRLSGQGIVFKSLT
jgi:DNA invertase Pin-like site-specific DNA recombinase